MARFPQGLLRSVTASRTRAGQDSTEGAKRKDTKQVGDDSSGRESKCSHSRHSYPSLEHLQSEKCPLWECGP